MKIELLFNEYKYGVDLNNPIDISIPLREGEQNPNCYYAESPKFETIISGDFIGSVSQGGPVNYQKITITPHGNGTHTECYGHISEGGATINQNLREFHFIAELISVKPKTEGSDSIITRELVEEKTKFGGARGLLIRTLPNSDDKLSRKYSGTNPPYFDADCLDFVVSQGKMHLLVDLPSVDKEVDGGKLEAHRIFWRFPVETRKNATITELIYVPEAITDGLYLVNLQTVSLETDASPSKPILFPMTRI